MSVVSPTSQATWIVFALRRLISRTVCAALIVATCSPICDAQTAYPLTPAATPPQQIDPKKEYNVKGVYVFNFGRYVTWPADQSLPRNEFRVGVIGASPILVPLNKLAKKRAVTDRRTGKKLPLKIHEFKSLKDYRNCHVLVVPRTVKAEDQKAILKRFANKPVLIVGESSGFARTGGTAGFVLLNGSIRFDLSVADAKRKGLTIDAKLLTAANKLEQKIEPNSKSAAQ